MTGIDRLISTSLSHIIKKKLNSDKRKNLERKLFLEHGMSIKLSIEDFHKFREVLKNISNIDKKNLKMSVLMKLLKLEKQTRIILLK